jgi:hypothetical protein
MGLEELIDVAGTADWRGRKAEDHPNDDRNGEAAELLDRLAKDMATLEGSDVHRRIEAVSHDTSGRFPELVSEELRAVGFHSWPESGRELLEGIAKRLEREVI